MKFTTLTFLASLALTAVGAAYEPSANYTVKKIEGWTVHVNNGLLGKGKHAKVGKEALKKLRSDLATVKTWIPDRPLKELIKVPIWLEVDTTNGPHGSTPVFHYHPGLDWLKEKDFHPGKHQCVELSRASAFVNVGKRSRTIVMHELAHGYHDRVLGYDNPEILAAYKNAVAGTGHPKRDWIRSRVTEYFAGVTQRYFGNKEERENLKKRDPEIVKILKRLYGEPKAFQDETK